MDWNGKKVLVTGPSGFIGSNLTRELLKRNAEVYAIDNFSYIDEDKSKRKNDFFSKIKLIIGNVTEDAPWLKVPEDIEYIFHFAAPSSITNYKREPERCYKETVFGFWKALEFAKNHKNVKKVVYPSTGSLYAGNEFPLNEQIYPKPRNLYAAAKMACEGLACSYSDFVKSIGLRIFAGYGPGEEWKKDFGSIVFLFLNDLMHGEKPVIWGDGKQTRDFVYIGDVVEGIVRAAEVDYIGRINIGTGVETSFNDMVDIMKRELGIEQETEHIPKEANYVENLKADTTLMKEVLRIEPMSLSEGINKYVKYLRENTDSGKNAKIASLIKELNNEIVKT